MLIRTSNHKAIKKAMNFGIETNRNQYKGNIDFYPTNDGLGVVGDDAKIARGMQYLK